MKISLIFTLKNESASILRLLDSLLAQTRPPDEVVVVDGGSTDGTLALVRAWAARAPFPVHVLVRDGCNISQGRNAAIAIATGEIIACTDAGVRLSPGWLEELMRPFETRETDVVSGFFIPDPQTVFETALAATTLPTLTEIRPETFLPSSRSLAFRREAWAKVGGYPEWLDFCEDLVFDFALRAHGCRFAFAPRALVYFRPRPNLCAFLRQYYQYARGDGKADLWRWRHAIRYTTYLLAGPLLLWLGVVQNPIWWLPLLLGLAAMVWRPYRRLVPLLAGYALGDKLSAVAWVPIIRIAGDVAKIVGYPVGVGWRLTRRK